MRYIELLLIALVLIAISVPNISKVEFHPDESDWIAMSNLLEAFVKGQFDSQVWNESNWTLTMPTITPYVIGIGRYVGGYHTADLNAVWLYSLDDSTNISRGAIPNDRLLWWSRLPMVILWISSALLLFVMIKDVADRIAGYVFLIMIWMNSYFSLTLSRAMNEAPLLACISVSMLAGKYAVDYWNRAFVASDPSRGMVIRSMIWFVLMGFFAGVAGEAKLNGLSVLATALILCILVSLAQTKTPGRSHVGVLIVTCLLIFLAAAVAFVALNPFLYNDPVGRLGKIIQYRLNLIQAQQTLYPWTRIDSFGIWLAVVPKRVLQTYATMQFAGAWILNLVLCFIGVSYFALEAIAWFHKERNKSGAVVVLAAAASIAIPALFTPLDWDRYYLLPEFFNTLFIATGISFIITKLTKIASRSVSIARSPA